MGTRKQAKPAQKKTVAAKDAKPKATRSKANASSTVVARTDADELAGLRIEMIARAAYLRAEQRGFEPGRELDDWLAAAADIDAQLERRSGA
jgi:Protein of unknown function (DUF2934)